MAKQTAALQTGHPAAAGISRRFVAYLVDWYIGALVTALPPAVYSMQQFGTVQNQNLLEFAPDAGLKAGALALLCAALYYVLVPLAVWRGQTLGKHWLKLRIVGADGAPVTAGQIIRRQVLGIVIIEGSLVSASTIWHQMATICTGLDFVRWLMYAGLVVSIASAVLVLMRRHRAVHDYIGGTMVIVDK